MEVDIERLRRLGGLHDATIEEVVWCKADRSLRLSIVDPPGVVTFVGMDGLTVETALFRGLLKIAGIDVDTRADGLEVRIGLSEPGSVVQLLCRDIRVAVGDR
jgi:hypothetical protein